MTDRRIGSLSGLAASCYFNCGGLQLAPDSIRWSNIISMVVNFDCAYRTTCHYIAERFLFTPPMWAALPPRWPENTRICILSI
jgi:hypothetical protein